MDWTCLADQSECQLWIVRVSSGWVGGWRGCQSWIGGWSEWVLFVDRCGWMDGPGGGQWWVDGWLGLSVVDR